MERYAYLLLGLMLPAYLILFGWMAPTYIENTFLLTGTPLGIVVLPGVPMTEVLWYFSWGSFAGIVLNMASGRRKTPLLN